MTQRTIETYFPYEIIRDIVYQCDETSIGLAVASRLLSGFFISNMPDKINLSKIIGFGENINVIHRYKLYPNVRVLAQACAFTGQTSFIKPTQYSPKLLNSAVAGGQLSTVKTIRAGLRGKKWWNVETCCNAIRYGHYHILEYLRDWRQFGNDIAEWSSHTCACAAEVGRLDMLRWLRSGIGDPNGKPCPWTANCYVKASYGDHVDVLEYLVESDCPRSSSVCRKVAMHCKSISLRFLLDHGFEWPNASCLPFINSNDIETVIWLRQRLVPFGKFYPSALSDEMNHYLFSHVAPTTTHVIDLARVKKLDMVKIYIRRYHNIRLIFHLMIDTLDLVMLRWITDTYQIDISVTAIYQLFDSTYRTYDGNIIMIDSTRNIFPTLRWLVEEKHVEVDQRVIYKSIYFNCMDIFAYLLNRIEFDKTYIEYMFSVNAKFNRIDFINLAYENYSMLFDRNYVQMLMSKHPSAHLVDWVIAKNINVDMLLYYCVAIGNTPIADKVDIYRKILIVNANTIIKTMRALGSISFTNIINVIKIYDIPTGDITIIFKSAISIAKFHEYQKFIVNFNHLWLVYTDVCNKFLSTNRHVDQIILLLNELKSMSKQIHPDILLQSVEQLVQQKNITVLDIFQRHQPISPWPTLIGDQREMLTMHGFDV
jgi:hypothetical protein